MPFGIQRVPQGLANLISSFGGQTPVALEDHVRGVIDLTQLYGLQQRATVQQAGVIVALALVNLPATTTWSVLFNACAQVTLTATMTAAACGVVVRLPGGPSVSHLSSYNEAGNIGVIPGVLFSPYNPTYPRVLPPGTVISAFLARLGTDANANVAITAELGLLG